MNKCQLWHINKFIICFKGLVLFGLQKQTKSILLDDNRREKPKSEWDFLLNVQIWIRDFFPEFGALMIHRGQARYQMFQWVKIFHQNQYTCNDLICHIQWVKAKQEKPNSISQTLYFLHVRIQSWPGYRCNCNISQYINSICHVFIALLWIGKKRDINRFYNVFLYFPSILIYAIKLKITCDYLPLYLEYIYLFDLKKMCYYLLF